VETSTVVETAAATLKVLRSQRIIIITIALAGGDGIKIRRRRKKKAFDKIFSSNISSYSF